MSDAYKAALETARIALREAEERKVQLERELAEIDERIRLLRRAIYALAQHLGIPHGLTDEKLVAAPRHRRTRRVARTVPPSKPGSSTDATINTVVDVSGTPSGGRMTRVNSQQAGAHGGRPNHRT